MVSVLDESVGLVFEALSKKGMLRDTLFVFASDNGGDAASPQANHAFSWPLKGQKYTPWEGGVRSSAVLRSWALQRGRGGEDYEHLFHVSDWLPTLYQMAGGVPADLGDIDGVSHAEALLTTSSPPRMEFVVNIDPIDNYSAIIAWPFKLVSGVAEKGDFEQWYPIVGNVTWDSAKPKEQCEASTAARTFKDLGLDPVCGSPGPAYATPIECGTRDPRRPANPQWPPASSIWPRTHASTTMWPLNTPG
ncbi:arylsulfatase B-like [Haemaphysalis longicornis]